MTHHDDNGIQMKLISDLVYLPELENYNPLNPAEVENLAESIRNNKYHEDEPITLAKIGGRDVIVDGFRRLGGLKHAGKKYAPCVYIPASTLEDAIKHAQRRQSTRRNVDKYTIIHHLIRSNLYTCGGDRMTKPTSGGLNPKITIAEFALLWKLSSRTVERYKAKYYDNITAEQRQEILSDKTAVYRVIDLLDQQQENQTDRMDESVIHNSDAATHEDKKKRVMRPKDAGETTLFRHLNLTVAEIEKIRKAAKQHNLTANTACTLFLRSILAFQSDEQHRILQEYSQGSRQENITSSLSPDHSPKSHAAANREVTSSEKNKKTKSATASKKRVERKPGKDWGEAEEILLNLRLLQNEDQATQKEIIGVFQEDYKLLGIKPRSYSSALHKIHRTIPLRQKLKKEGKLTKVEQEVLSALRANPPIIK